MAVATVYPAMVRMREGRAGEHHGRGTSLNLREVWGGRSGSRMLTGMRVSLSL